MKIVDKKTFGKKVRKETTYLNIALILQRLKQKKPSGNFTDLKFTFHVYLLIKKSRVKSMFNPGVWEDDSVLRHKGHSSTMNDQNKQNNNSVRASRFFCTFLCLHCTSRMWKMSNFTFYEGHKQATTKFSFSFWSWIYSALGNLTPGEFAYIWKSKWLEIIEMKIERTWIDIFSEVFFAAVLGLRERIFATLGPLDSVVVQFIL